jgi:hypothetical protein
MKEKTTNRAEGYHRAKVETFIKIKKNIYDLFEEFRSESERQHVAYLQFESGKQHYLMPKKVKERYELEQKLAMTYKRDSDSDIIEYLKKMANHSEVIPDFDTPKAAPLPDQVFIADIDSGSQFSARAGSSGENKNEEE